MAAREHLISLLDKPKARKYRDKSDLIFTKLKVVKPGALAELDKLFIKPTPPKYVFYSHINLGPDAKVTESMAKELIKIGIPNAVYILGEIEPKGLLEIINEMASTKRVDKYGHKVKFTLDITNSINVIKLLNLMESKTLEEQDKLASDLNKLNFCPSYNNTKQVNLKINEVMPSSIISSKLIASMLRLLTNNKYNQARLGLGAVGPFTEHRTLRLNENIIDLASLLFTNTSTPVLVEGVKIALSNYIDERACLEVEYGLSGGLTLIKIVHLMSDMTVESPHAIYTKSFQPEGPHKPNDKTKTYIYKTIELISGLKNEVIGVKVQSGPIEELLEGRLKEVEYATIKIAAKIDATLAKITSKEVTKLIDKCDKITVYSFLACLPNATTFYDKDVETPAAIDIMELEQVKNPSTFLVSKSINLNGVNLNNVTGVEAQNKLQQFITACLIAPPTDRKQELCYTPRTISGAINLLGTFRVNQTPKEATGYTTDKKIVGIHVASGATITYENIKPILNAIKSIEDLMRWLATTPPEETTATPPELHADESEIKEWLKSNSNTIKKNVYNILVTKLKTTHALAIKIAELCSIPRRDLLSELPSMDWKLQANIEAKLDLAHYLSHAILQTGIVMSFPTTCQASELMAKNIKEFASKHNKQCPYTTVNKITTYNPNYTFYNAVSTDYYVGDNYRPDTAVYEAMDDSINKASTLTEAFALDLSNNMKKVIEIKDCTASSIYASMPCVGFDKDDNYIFKIKEFTEINDHLTSGTNLGRKYPCNQRAIIKIEATEDEAGSLINYFKFGQTNIDK